MNKLNRTKIRRVQSSHLPSSLPNGELIFCTDTQTLFIGTGDDTPLKKVNGEELASLREAVDGFTDITEDTNKNTSDIAYLTNKLDGHSHDNLNYLDSLTMSFKVLTKQEYANLPTKDNNTLYFVLED